MGVNRKTRKLVRIMAKRLVREADAGNSLVVVPARHRARIEQLLWELRVSDAAETWERRNRDVTLSDWQSATDNAMERGFPPR